MADTPAVKSYLHKPTGERMAGAVVPGALTVNGEAVPPGSWSVRREGAVDGGETVYLLSFPIGDSIGASLSARRRISDRRAAKHR